MHDMSAPRKKPPASLLSPLCWVLVCWSALPVAQVPAGENAPASNAKAAPEKVSSPPAAGAGFLGPVETAHLTLHDARGNQHGIWPTAESKLLVVAFWGCQCPLAVRYAARLEELAAEYVPQGVDFVAVNSNDQDSLTDIANFVQQHRMRIPLLKDSQHQAADAFQAVRTPEMFVIDRQGKLYYRGRIDDQNGIGYEQPTIKNAFLADAVRRALQGETSPSSVAVGCLIGRRPPVTPKGQITFSNTVAAIFHRRCVECHRNGQLAPFSLLDFHEAAGWAPMIREVIEQGRMPPWLANPRIGKFSNDMRLSADERQKVLAWIDDGCPEGDLSQVPPPPAFAEGWRISQPDVVWYMRDEPFEVKLGERYAYQTFFVDPKLTEDRWIQEGEIRPGNVEVVHHASVWVAPPGAPKDGYLVQPHVAYGPGAPPMRLPKGSAIFFPAGSTLRFEMHYEPKGQAVMDRTGVGFKFADPTTVRRPIAIDALLADQPLLIPAGADHHEVHGSFLFGRDAELVALLPHMHLRGKAFRFELERPGHEREVLLDVPRYEFSWQNWYDLAEPKVLPKGSRLHAVGVFDNSTDNLRNPAPDKDVKGGIRTTDEMFVGVFMAYDSRGSRGPIREYQFNVEGFGASEAVEWSLKQTAPAEAALVESSTAGDTAKVSVTAVAQAKHGDVRLRRSAAGLRAGQTGVLYFQVRASKPRKLQVQVVDSQDPEQVLGLSRELTIGPAPQNFNEEFVCPQDAAELLLEFGVGQTFGDVEFSQIALLQGSHR